MSGQFILKNGSIFVLAEAMGGVYNTDQLRLICEIADSESAFLKITEDHRIGLMIPEETLPEMQKSMAKCGLLLKHYRQAGPISVKACLGELCPLAEQDALGDAFEVSAHFNKTFGQARPFVTLGINGCGQACAGSATDDIHVVAENTGYKITIGGQSRELPTLGQFVADNIPKELLPVMLGALLEVFFTHQEIETERIVDVIERVGLSPFTEACEKLQPSLLDTSAEEFTEASSDFGEDIDLSAENEETDVPQLALSQSSDESAHEIDGDSSESPESPESPESWEIADDEFPQSLNSADLSPENDGYEAQEIAEDDTDAFLDDTHLLEIDEEALHASDEVSSDSQTSEHSLTDDESTYESTYESSDALEVESSEVQSMGEEEFLDESPDPAATQAATGEELSGTQDDFSEETPEAEGISLADANTLLMSEEDGLDIEDATLEDVERVTHAIRSELSLENEGHQASLPPPSKSLQSASSLADSLHSVASLGTALSQVPPDQLHRHEPARVKSPVLPGRFKVSAQDGQLHITLPGGLECQIPLDSLSADGQALDIDIAGESLLLERQGDTLIFRTGGVLMRLPMTIVLAKAA